MANRLTNNTVAEVAAKRPSKDAGRGVTASPFEARRGAEPVIGPATSGRTRWLAPQDEEEHLRVRR
jgi:hypothetical protein